MRTSNILGELLRNFRERAGKSMQEVASNLGITRGYLSKVECGHEHPSREFLTKAQSIYSLSAENMTRLLLLSGYREKSNTNTVKGNFARKEVTINMNDLQMEPVSNPGIQLEVPETMDILYSDSVFITSSPYGVVITFAQVGSTPTKQKAIARIGMSKIHGHALANTLKNNLENSEKVIVPSKKIIS